MSPTKFGYWRRRLAGGRRGTTKAEPIDSQPLRLVGAAAVRAPLEIAFASGERVLVHEGASAEALAMVVGTLRARC